MSSYNRHLIAALLVSSPAFAGGFAVSEQDASASGRGSTAIAASATASSIHFNPAGLGGLEGAAISAGATAIVPSATATNGSDSASALPGVKTPPHVYGAYGFGRFSLGAGFNAPFGGGLKWPETWRGRTELVEMNLQVLAGHLGGAFQINKQFSIGLAAALYRASVSLDKRVDFVDGEGKALLGGSGLGFGASAGVQYTPMKELTIGLMGRIPATVNMTGRVHFEDVPGAFQNTLPDQAISTTLVLPAKVALGAVGTLPWLRLSADIEYTFWSSFKTFSVDFENPNTPDVNQPRSWADAPTFRLGAEKDFGLTVVRLGGLVDLAASPSDTLSPSLPDSTRIGFSAGLGRSFGPFRADLAYQFIAFLPRASTGEAFPAQYTANAHLISLSLGWAYRNTP
jgi:long-chain fatty acid transport protein